MSSWQVSRMMSSAYVLMSSFSIMHVASILVGAFSSSDSLYTYDTPPRVT